MRGPKVFGQGWLVAESLIPAWGLQRECSLRSHGEKPWMVGSHQHWGYSKEFYNNRLSPEQRKLFHGFLFDPQEERWG